MVWAQHIRLCLVINNYSRKIAYSQKRVFSIISRLRVNIISHRVAGEWCWVIIFIDFDSLKFIKDSKQQRKMDFDKWFNWLKFKSFWLRVDNRKIIKY